MTDINLIDNWQAHLPRAIRFEHRIHSSEVTRVMIDNEPHLIRTCKTSLFFAPLAVRVHKTVNTLIYFKNPKMYCFLNYKYFLYIRYNKMLI